MQVEDDKKLFLNFPPPDRAVFLQSPPPETAEFVEETEDAPSRAGPIDFLPGVLDENSGKIIYKPKCFRAPTIVIEGTE